MPKTPTAPDPVEAALARDEEFHRLVLQAGPRGAEYWRSTTAEHDRHALAAEVRRLREQRCAWTEDENGNWATACGHLYCFITGGPKHNLMVFCCYCGRPLVEVTFLVIPEDDDV